MARVLPSGIQASGRWLAPEQAVRAVAAAVEGELWREVVPRIRKRLGQAAATAALALVAALALAVIPGVVPRRDLPAEAGVFHAAALIAGTVGLAGALALWLSARALRPPRRLQGISIVYYPLLAMPLEGGVALHDLGGATAPTAVSLRRPRDQAALARLAAELRQSIDRLRILEPADDLRDGQGGALFGIDGKLRRLVAQVGESLADVATAQVRVPAVPAADPLALAAVRFWPAAVEADAGPAALAGLEPVYRVNREIEGVQAAAHSAELSDLDDLLAEIEACTDLLQARLRHAHLKSLDLIHNTGGLAGQVTASSAHAVFCPFCNGPRPAAEATAEGGDSGRPELADATRLQRGPEGDLRCPHCGRDVPAEAALVVSRLRHELFHPVFDQLVLSVRSEILAIDRDVENQLVQLAKEQRVKLQDLKMQLEQEQRRRAARVRELESRSAALEAQVRSLTAVLAQYDRLSAAQRDKYQRDCEETQEHNRAEARRMIASLREESEAGLQAAERDSQRNGQIRREEEDRRTGLVAAQVAAVHERLGEANQLLEGLGRAAMMSERDKERVRDTGNPFHKLNPVKIIGRWGAVARSKNSFERTRG